MLASTSVVADIFLWLLTGNWSVNVFSPEPVELCFGLLILVPLLTVLTHVSPLVPHE